MKRFAQLALVLLISIASAPLPMVNAQGSSSNAVSQLVLTAPAIPIPLSHTLAVSNTIYLPIVVSPPIRVLWTNDCDPRSDPGFCHISDSLTILNEFYATLRDIRATIQYSMPQSLDQLKQYDVVIADYCSSLYRSSAVPLLSQYIAQGGSVIVLADNFCIVGSDNQGNVSAARAD